MKPRPLESLRKTLPGPKWALSFKLGKFVEIGSKKKCNAQKIKYRYVYFFFEKSTRNFTFFYKKS